MQTCKYAVPLSSIKKNDTAEILGFKNPDRELANRLTELGFIHGSIITSCGKAPFGDPLIFIIHGGKLALRKSDAANILVMPQ
ncbi:MAG TPA: FeoA family protein [Methanocorpusculum sp.]|nr:FeoA family protein [Methanocorpusculum sp.]